MKDFRKTADECRTFLLEIGRLIKCSFIPVAIFTIGYVMLSTLVIMVAADRFARIGGMLSRVHYISADNIMGLIKEPNGVVFIFIAYWGTVCLISLFQLAGLIHAFSMARAGEKATLSGMIAAGFRGCFKTLNPKNWLIIVPVLVLIPISGIAMIHGAAVYIEMPSFIADVIDQSTLYHLAYIGLYLILVVLVIICIYSFHSYFLEDKSFIAACRESVKLVKGNFWQTLGTILALFFAVSCITISMSSILSSVNTWMTSVIHTSTTEYALLSDTVDAMVGIHIIITATIAPVISVCALTVMYYSRLEATGSKVKITHGNRPLRKSVTAVIAVAVVVLTAGYIVDNQAMFEMLMQDSIRPEVVAHRGDSARRPENTIPAFELAIAEDTDWIELDVHETKDGEIIVSHDDDLSRVSGKEIFVHDMNYDELKDLDTGSWFSEDYGYIRLTKLEDVLALCKDKVHLQIEIKPTEYDHQLEEKLLKIIYDAGMEKQVTIISLSEKPLKRIKELDPDMKTCYCMALALGRLDMIDFSDDVTVEATRVEEKVVANLHKVGKKCCVWTVNSTEKVQYLVDCGVDMIVTDDPIAIQHALDEAEYSGGLRRILRLYKIRLYTGY